MRLFTHISISTLVLFITINVAFSLDCSSDPFKSQYERLLKTYSVHKGWGDLPVEQIEQKFSSSPDRLNTVQALLWAAQIELRSNQPLIGCMEAVKGIWGVRPGLQEGRHQFRISVVWKKGIKQKMDATGAFSGSIGAHVLEPGGDDDPNYQFPSGRSARTWRQTSDVNPRLQVSILRSNETIGEMDLDYDGWLCHTKPSNSDSGAKGNDSHNDMLNAAFQFMPAIQPNCINKSGHCKKSYTNIYCE